jgi:hypothetical protein
LRAAPTVCQPLIAQAAFSKILSGSSHDDGSLLQNSLLELLVRKHNGAIEEYLILQSTGIASALVSAENTIAQTP